MSADQMAPPTSMWWATLAANPNRPPSRRIGVTTVKSGRWPVEIQGSFVITTSPSRQVSAGSFSRTCVIVFETQPTKLGIDQLFSATAVPCRSSRMQL